MEVAGLVVGIAGLFSVCLDTLDKVYSYRDSEAASRQLIVRFEAERLRLSEWANAVGIRDGVLDTAHHPRLDDVAVKSVVYHILYSIIELFPKAERIISDLQDIKPLKKINSFPEKIGPTPTPTTRETAKLSTKNKMKWMFGADARFTRQVEAFEFLADKLYSLIPVQIASKPSEVGNTDILGPTAQDFQVLSGVHQGLQTLLESNRRQTLEEQRRALDEVLEPPKVPDDLAENLVRRLDGTCEWIFPLQAYKEWSSPNDSPETAKLFWICGAAGTGKSVLSARIISKLKEEPDVHLFHFFCSQHVQSGGTPDGIIRSFVSSIIRHNDAILEFIGEAFATEFSFQPSMQDIWSMLGRAAAQLPNCIFVIDGLDEYNKSKHSRQEFLATLKRSLAGTSTRILITSRDEVDLRAELVPEEPEDGIILSHHKLQKSDTEADVNLYSKSIVKQRLSRKDEQFQEELATTLAQRCDGMFLWISLSGQCLRGGLSKARIINTIEKVPDGLSSAYARSWDLILGQPEYERARAIQILRWCIFSLRPLTVGELTEALVVDLTSSTRFDSSDLPDEIDKEFVDGEIIDLCSSLIETRSVDQKQPLVNHNIQLVHFSVKDFLLSVIGTVSLGDHELSVENHLFLAKICLQYLCSTDSAQSEPNTEGKRFLSYALNNWHVHRQNSGDYDDDLCQMAATFFRSDKQNLKAWGEVIEKYLFTPLALPVDETQVKANALYYAVSLNMSPAMEILIKEGKYSINDRGGGHGTALNVACALGYKDCFSRLIGLGAKLDLNSGPMGSPLHAVAYANRVDIAKELLARKLDANIKNDKGDTPLYVACVRGHQTIVELLVDAGGDPNILLQNDWTPFHAAASNGREVIVKFLLSRGADPSKQMGMSWTALNLAAYYNHMNVVKLLVEAAEPKTIDLQNSVGWTAFANACSNGLEETISLFLKQGADPSIANETGWIAMHHVASKGHTNIAKLLLEHSGDSQLSAKTKDGESPLHVAGNNNKVEMAQFLLESGADINALSNRGNTPLNDAVLNGSFEAVKLLLSKGADMRTNSDNHAPPMNNASWHGHLKIAEALLDAGAEVNVRNKWDWTPIHAACHGGHLEVTKMLLSRGGDLDIPITDGKLPIHSAASLGRIEIVRFLLDLKNGSSDASTTSETTETEKKPIKAYTYVNTPGSEDDLPLHLAASAGHAEVVKLLIERGAEIDARNSKGLTSLYKAAYEGHTEAARVLLSHNASSELADVNSWTPLNAACFKGHLEVVKLLLEHNASTSLATNDGRVPLQTAVSNGNIEILKLLLDHGAAVDFKDDIGIAPLYVAARNGKLDMARELLDRGASVNCALNDGLQPLHAAADQGHLEVVELLLDRGGDIDGRSAVKETPLIWAAKMGRTDIVQLLVKRGAAINLVDHESHSALYNAAYWNRIDSVRVLLESGADRNIRDKDNCTILDCASSLNQLDIVKLLCDTSLKCYADPEYDLLLVTRLFSEKQWDMALYLLQAGIDVRVIEGGGGRTLIHYAAGESSLEIVKTLLPPPVIETTSPVVVADETTLEDTTNNKPSKTHDKQADPSAATTQGNSDASIENGKDGNTSSTPAYVNCFTISEIDNAPKLTLRGSPKEDQHWYERFRYVLDNEGRTAMHCAVLEDNVPVMEYLFGLGFDLAAKDKRGRTVLDYACISGYSNVLAWVLEHQSFSPESQTGLWSPLHWVCSGGDFDMIKLLGDAGYKSSEVTTDDPPVSWTPCDIATYSCNGDLMIVSSEKWREVVKCGIVIENPKEPEGISANRANDLLPPGWINSDDMLCDGCALPLVGPYFHCNDCYYYHYCFMCKQDADLVHNPDHVWEKFTMNNDCRDKHD